MVEVTVQLTSTMSDSVREIANKQFEGSVPAVLNAALELYLNIQRATEKSCPTNSAGSGSSGWY